MREDRKKYLIARAYNKLQCKLLRLAVKDFRRGRLTGRRLEKICLWFGLNIDSERLYEMQDLPGRIYSK